MSQPDTLLVTDLGGGVRELRLNKPEVLNRLDPQTHVDLVDVLSAIGQDRTVRAIVLASTGKAFSAGGDFDLMTEAHDDPDARRGVVDNAARLIGTFLDLRQPIVAAVQGPAIGLGSTVALMCDAVVAARAAVFADTHVNIGLVAGDGGCLAWPAAAGMLRARRYLLTGDPIKAELAYEFGMVTDLVETAEEADQAAIAIARRIAANAPMAVQSTKRILNQVSRQRAGEILDLSLVLETETLASQDLLEGIAAFREKRAPQYQGS